MDQLGYDLPPLVFVIHVIGGIGPQDIPKIDKTVVYFMVDAKDGELYAADIEFSKINLKYSITNFPAFPRRDLFQVCYVCYSMQH